MEYPSTNWKLRICTLDCNIYLAAFFLRMRSANHPTCASPVAETYSSFEHLDSRGQVNSTRDLKFEDYSISHLDWKWKILNSRRFRMCCLAAQLPSSSVRPSWAFLWILPSLPWASLVWAGAQLRQSCPGTWWVSEWMYHTWKINHIWKQKVIACCSGWGARPGPSCCPSYQDLQRVEQPLLKVLAHRQCCCYIVVLHMQASDPSLELTP